MKRATVHLAEAVFNFSNPYCDASWLSWPWQVIASVSARLADWLDPIPPRD